jgi:outer membrane protein assembly factor BamB
MLLYLVLSALLISESYAATDSGSGNGKDWPQFRGPTRDGISTETGLLSEWPKEGPKLQWSAEDIGKGFSHVSTADGIVYVTGLVDKEGVLHAFTLDGKRKWKISYGPEYDQAHPGARTIPTVHEGLVYVISAFGKLSCFQAEDGKPVWSADLFRDYDAQPIQWGFSESVLIDGERAIATPVGTKAAMTAMDRKTGKPLWASQPLEGEASFCSPLMVQHGKIRMIVTLTNQVVAAFSPEDGKILWQFPYQNARQNHPVTPIYHDGLLYVTSGYGKGAVALAISDDGNSVKQIWEQPKQDPVHGQAVLVDGYVYASSHQNSAGRWTCVEFASGKLMWEDRGVGKGGSVIYADGMLYCYSEDGTVGLVKPSPEKCQVISTFKVPMGDGTHWAHPVVSFGRLFMRHGTALMCYDIAKGD